MTTLLYKSEPLAQFLMELYVEGERIDLYGDFVCELIQFKELELIIGLKRCIRIETESTYKYNQIQIIFYDVLKSEQINCLVNLEPPLILDNFSIGSISSNVQYQALTSINISFEGHSDYSFLAKSVKLKLW